jgi:hypothetical protein
MIGDVSCASAAPFAGMTQTGSMGLISAARPRGTPVPLTHHPPFRARPQERGSGMRQSGIVCGEGILRVQRKRAKRDCQRP